MRILLTGGTGFVGSHVAEALVGAGHAVRCVVRAGRDPGWLRDLGIERAEGDLSGAGMEAAVGGVDAVVHMAGLTRGSRRRLWEVNVRGTERLLAACRRAGRPGLRFVFGSSQAAAGPSAPDRPRTEDDPPRPTTAYGASKLEAERIVMGAGDGLVPVVLRFVTVYGPRDRDILPVFRWALRGLGFVAGEDEPRFQLVYARDAAKAVLAALEREVAAGTTLFIGHPRPCNWLDVLAALEAALDRPIRPLRVSRGLVLAGGAVASALRLGHVKPGGLDIRRARDLYAYWLCDMARARRTLDWSAETDLGRGLRETVRWYREAGWL